MANGIFCSSNEHQWSRTYEDFVAEATEWHEHNSAPAGNSYTAERAVHYWDVAACEACGLQRLLSTVYDREGAESISDDNFLWLTLFITQLNEEIGQVEAKKELINYALDQLPWEYYPHIKLTDPDQNIFSISFQGEEYAEVGWPYFEAFLMFRAMNARAREYLPAKDIKDIEGPFTEFERLKAKYQTLMEIASQAGYSHDVKEELSQLYEMLEKLSEVLKRFT